MSKNLLNVSAIKRKNTLFPKVTGKFTWKDLPKDYLQWVSRQDNLDEDMQYTVENYLK